LQQPTATDTDTERLIAYQTLLALVGSDWGCTQVLRSRLFPLILDRNAEAGNNEGKHLKYQVVKALLERRELCLQVAGTNGLESIARYYHQGAFWVPVEERVSVADQSA
jgi:hypothetical protein